MSGEKEFNSVKQKALEYLLSTPEVVVSLFFMWLCGLVISFLFLQTNPSFTKHKKFIGSQWLSLAIGFLPCAIVMVLYHAFTQHKFLCNLEDLSITALPSSLILGGITCVIFFWRVIKNG